MRGLGPASGLVCAALALGCTTPIVEDRVHEVHPPSLERLAVAPFAPSPDFRTGVQPLPADPKPPGSNDPLLRADAGPLRSSAPDAPATGGQAAEAAALVTRIAGEAFAAQGFDVVPASDLVQTYTARGERVPQGDARALAERASREFGATAVLLGTVYRYRLREGGELGATRPASVGYQLALHAAPGGRLLWSARFDHTQRAISEDVLRARQYPGGGSRWLSAPQLARWGAEAAARRLAELR